jgi:hypothetical protein
VADPRADLVALVKPQFEAGPADVGSGGVVREPAVWRTGPGGSRRRVPRTGGRRPRA